MPSHLLNLGEENDESEDMQIQKEAVGALADFAKPEEEKKVNKPETDELPALDDLLQCFTADGVFEEKHMKLLRGFLTDDSLKILDELLAKFAGNPTIIGYVLSVTCNLIFEERFGVFKGEWELMQRKLKKSARNTKSLVEESVLEQLEQMQCKDE